MARNKKKIIRACTVSNSIGFFAEVVDKMKNDGYEPVVVTSPGSFMDKFINEYPDIRTVSLQMERRISLFRDAIALIKMIRLFVKERPYIVHSITPKAGLLCMIAGWVTGVPIRIHTFTGLVWPTSKGLKRKILMTTDRILCACATHINPEGYGVLDDLRNGGITKKPMKVLGYGNVMGVDMERFDPKRFNVNLNSDSNRPFTYVFVGRIVGDKGIHELVEAFIKLQEKYTDIQLNIIGRYEIEPDSLNTFTRRVINENENIHCIGIRFGEELIKEYLKADCFVMPSYREGFPNSVLEAGALGKACVVTDINGSREIVENGVNGLVVPPMDAKALHEAMEYMLVNSDERKHMVQNARKMIKSRFERNYVQQCMIDFYNEIIKK